MYAYVLISLSVPTERELVEDFLAMDQVEEAHILFGEWDLILKVQGDSPEAISGFIIEKIRNLEEVQLTSTLIVAE